MATTQIIKFPRILPKRTTSNEVLVNTVENDHHGRIKHLASGETVILVSELGFMELIYHVAVYKPAPRPLRRNRMVLRATEELRDASFEEALEKFEQAD